MYQTKVRLSTVSVKRCCSVQLFLVSLINVYVLIFSVLCVLQLVCFSLLSTVNICNCVRQHTVSWNLQCVLMKCTNKKLLTYLLIFMARRKPMQNCYGHCQKSMKVIFWIYGPTGRMRFLHANCELEYCITHRIISLVVVTVTTKLT